MEGRGGWWYKIMAHVACQHSARTVDLEWSRARKLVQHFPVKVLVYLVGEVQPDRRCARRTGICGVDGLKGTRHDGKRHLLIVAVAVAVEVVGLDGSVTIQS